MMAGKQQAIGRLIGSVMQRSGGQADAKAVREILLSKLSQSPGPLLTRTPDRS